jgi:uncharacterized protein GlcG (DUF336 family)
MRAAIAALSLLGLSAPLCAQDNAPGPAPRAPGPKLDAAIALVQAAIATCRATGDHVAALVVDSGNVPVALLADDGSVVLAQTLAPRKTALVLKYKAGSAVIAERARADAALAAEIKADPKIGFVFPGAYPLLDGDMLLGAIAVSGGSSPEKDDSCAKAAVGKAGARLR